MPAMAAATIASLSRVMRALEAAPPIATRASVAMRAVRLALGPSPRSAYHAQQHIPSSKHQATATTRAQSERTLIRRLSSVSYVMPSAGALAPAQALLTLRPATRAARAARSQRLRFFIWAPVFPSAQLISSWRRSAACPPAHPVTALAGTAATHAALAASAAQRPERPFWTQARAFRAVLTANGLVQTARAWALPIRRALAARHSISPTVVSVSLFVPLTPTPTML